MTPVRVPIPPGPSYDELIILVRGAVRDSLQEGATDQIGSAFQALLNVLYERYFLSTQLSLPSDQGRDVDRMIGFLLDICQDSSHGSSRRPDVCVSRTALQALVGPLITQAAEARSSVEGDKQLLSLDSFYATLVVRWESILKSRETTWSPMPWSAQSLKQGIPPPPEAFDYKAAVATVPSHNHPSVLDDFVSFPDMPWLGGPHDGHCRAISLSAYVWLRLYAVRSSHEHLALWQSALTFGVLEALTGTIIPETFLLSPHPDRPERFIITSQSVSRVISSWLYLPPEALDIASLPGRLRDADEIISWAQLAIDEAARDLTGGIFAHAELGVHEAEDIISSLFTLHRLLHRFLLNVRIYTNINYSPDQQPSPLGCISAELVTEDAFSRKMASGWCPYTLRLLRQGDAGHLFLRACFSQPYLRTGAPEHDDCTDNHCVYHYVDTTSYTTRHAEECADPAGCRFFAPSLKEVTQHLSSGEIPVMIYEGGVLAVRSASDGPYVAISHVWMDGLGSTTEDGLPACQISRIATYARMLVPGGAFWVDSLCVPAARDLRKRAIRLMAETYARADKVVVFDASMRALCTPASTMADVVVRLAASPWMQRVWTLQEALLARELYLEFLGGLFPVGCLADARAHALKPTVSALGLIPHNMPMAMLVPLGLSNILSRSSMTCSFDDVVVLLEMRTTSHPADETVAIAGLLGVDVGKLLAEPDADSRMKAFLLEVKTLPANIIFNNIPAKLPFPGFRWAPRTLTTLGAYVDSSYGSAQCTAEGLTTDQELAVIRLPTTRIRDFATRPNWAMVVRDPARARTYLVSAEGQTDHVRGTTVEFDAIVAPPGMLEELSGSDLSSARAMNAALVCTDGSCANALADLSSSSDGPVKCQYLFYITISVFEALPLSTGGRVTASEAAAWYNWPLVELQSSTLTRITMT
ncbi:hypothetical protein C8Q80DRAFT_374934 [Daedaleopsis nitida]|nr:hypothetical protein C8Q80DRAFT_374934 [Daedaleopsis nitida]